MSMNHPTLTKMVADQRSRELSKHVARATTFERPVERREGMLARWAAMVRTRLAQAGDTSTSTGKAQCCPAT